MPSRREFLKNAAYAAPAIMTLNLTLTRERTGSAVRPDYQPQDLPQPRPGGPFQRGNWWE